MNFSEQFPDLPLRELAAVSHTATDAQLDRILAQGHARDLNDFAALLSPVASRRLEELAALSQRITQRHFGKTIRLFAPLYLSNECINTCKYCGFSRNNDIPRVTLDVAEVADEARRLARQGFRSILLVAGEHPKYVSKGYVSEVIEEILPFIPSVALELGPLETAPYRMMVEAGAEGLICYQESYDEHTYRDLHPAGPKKNFFWRMDTPERAYAAGFRRLGIGPLFGLQDWRFEALSTAAHARHLLKHCWKASLSLSLPRMRPAAGGWSPEDAFHMHDRELVQAICAFRLFLPTAAVVVSTREHPGLRNGLVRLGTTSMSAGSSTEPGGYKTYDENTWQQTKPTQEGEQFHIADERSPRTIAEMIREQGYEPVWKDFDASLVSSKTTEVELCG
jgi:2-iminoacetate synthase